MKYSFLALLAILEWLSSVENHSSRPFGNVLCSEYMTSVKSLIKMLTLLSVQIAFFDQEIMNSVHPVVSSEFNSSNHASWLETAFLLTSTTSQPLYARISDVIGRRLTNTFSLGAYALGTCLSGLAPSFWTFIAARALCGIGAGGVLGMAPIITNDLVPIRIRGTYQAYINLVLGLGASIGSISGGFLSDKLGWRWIFVFEIPPILAVLVVVYVSVPSSLGRYLEDCSTPKQHWNDFDVIGLSLFTILIALMISVLSLGGNVLSWTHPYILVSSSMSVLATAALVHVERRAPFPAMPFAKRLIQPNANLILSNLFAYMGDSAILFNAPLFFQAVKLQSASSSGARLGFPNLAGAVFGILSGFLISFTGRMKWPMVLGCTFMVVGSFLLSIPLRGVPNWLVTIFLLPSSIGMGLDTPATSVALVAACTPVDQAIMTSALNVFRRIGKILGVLISSTLFQNAMTVYLERFVTGANKIVVWIGASCYLDRPAANNWNRLLQKRGSRCK